MWPGADAVRQARNLRPQHGRWQPHVDRLKARAPERGDHGGVTGGRGLCLAPAAQGLQRPDQRRPFQDELRPDAGGVEALHQLCGCRPALKPLKPSDCIERKFNEFSARTTALKSLSEIARSRSSCRTVSLRRWSVADFVPNTDDSESSFNDSDTTLNELNTSASLRPPHSTICQQVDSPTRRSASRPRCRLHPPRPPRRTSPSAS
jgi:hypothetical protein